MKPRLLISMVLFALAACGGDSPTSPSAPTPAPAPAPTPARSVLTASVIDPVAAITSRDRVGNVTLICARFTALIRVTETAGLAATVTESDVFLRGSNGDISERKLIQRSDPVQANGTYEAIVERTACGYDGREWPFTLVYTLSLVDAKSNNHTLTGESAFVVR